MSFQSAYNFVELSGTSLRRSNDPRAIAVPDRRMGILDLLRAFRLGEHQSWPYGIEVTILGLEQLLLSARDPAELARHIHDQILYDPRVYDSLAKLDASVVLACDGEFEEGPNTFTLRVGQHRLPLGLLFVGQPLILERSGSRLGYYAPFKLSG